MATESTDRSPSAAAETWRTLFEDRYGLGAEERLLALFQQPCVTFAQIAEEFGVTRERVRQWHQRLLPGAPRGHERQRLCREYQRKRRLLQDQLFLGFYRRVRAQIPGQRVTLIPSREGFRKRTVRIDGSIVLLRRAGRSALTSQLDGVTAYTLVTGAAQADFIYYELSAADYLLVPRDILPPRATTFLDTDGSKYRRFKNTLAAILPDARAQQAS